MGTLYQLYACQRSDEQAKDLDDREQEKESECPHRPIDVYVDLIGSQISLTYN
jgi:hypothetical protein